MSCCCSRRVTYRRVNAARETLETNMDDLRICHRVYNSDKIEAAVRVVHDKNARPRPR